MKYNDVIIEVMNGKKAKFSSWNNEFIEFIDNKIMKNNEPYCPSKIEAMGIWELI